MAKSARRMRHHRSARRHHYRGGMSELSPAMVDAPAGDAMAFEGPHEKVNLGPNDQMAMPDWKKTSIEELGYGAGDAKQMGGRRRRSHKRRGGMKHSRRGGRKTARKHHKKGSRRYSRRHMKKGGSCGCGGSMYQ